MSSFLKQSAQRLGSSPREVLGNEVVESLRAAILKTFPSTPTEDILEICGTSSQIHKKFEESARRIPDEKLPYTLYAVVHTVQPVQCFVVGIMSHRISLESSSRGTIRKSSTHMEGSIFYLHYEVHQATLRALPRIRVTYVAVGEHLRKQGLFNQVSHAIANFRAQDLAGSIVEVQGQNLIAVMRVANLLEAPRFIEIPEPKDYPIKKALESDFVDILQKAELLNESEAEDLRGRIASLPKENNDEWNTQATALHNRFVKFIRLNYQQHRSEAPDEVNFLFERLKAKIGMGFIQENPSRGNLWVEAWLPNTLRPSRKT